MLFVLGLLALIVLPSVIGLAHDRRVDRQIREAERARLAAEGLGARERPVLGRRYFTTTVTHHS